MKSYKIFVLIITLSISCKYQNKSKIIGVEEKKSITNDTIVSKKYWGKYYIYTETEATTTGMASISYYFTINQKGAFLETNTYHEPIKCNGKYKIIDKKSYIELHYDDDDVNCNSEYPYFEIKIINNEFLIKGVGNEATSIEWLELKRK